MDNITLKRIDLLHPKIREQVREAYLHINSRILGKGVRLRFAYTLRTIQEQDALYALGRTKLFDDAGKRQGKVTNAKGGQSIHNYGVAWDIVLLLDKNGDGTFESASWDAQKDFDGDGKADWMEAVQGFKDMLPGVEWGGDWIGFKDLPHFQMDFGYRWADLQEKLASGDFETELIDGKEYRWANL